MKIKAFVRDTVEKEVDVQFPIYTQWIDDYSTTFNRVDSEGVLISITRRDRGNHRPIHPTFEIEHSKINISPIDGSYIRDTDGGQAETNFFKALDEMQAALTAIRSALRQP